jgi:Family of unknown function (DUF6460)
MCRIAKPLGARTVQVFFSGLIKLALASLIAGTLLSLFGLTPRAALDSLGLTAQDVQDSLVTAFAWAAPRMLMGAIVIIPLWFVTYMLMPPRG